MRFIYPARLHRAGPDEIVVSFRDLPECLTSGRDESEALSEAGDALEEAIGGRIVDKEPIPRPSARRAGEHRVGCRRRWPPRRRRCWRSGTAACLGSRSPGASASTTKVVRRMLDPRHATTANRLHRALRLLGREFVVESTAA